MTPESIQQRLFIFSSRGIIEGSQMAQTIRNHPEILFLSEPQIMDSTLESISDFFSAEEVSKNFLIIKNVIFKLFDR